MIGWVGVLVGVLLGIVLAIYATEISFFLERLFGFQIMPGDVYYVTRIPSDPGSSDTLHVHCRIGAFAADVTRNALSRAPRVPPWCSRLRSLCATSNGSHGVSLVRSSGSGAATFGARSGNSFVSMISLPSRWRGSPSLSAVLIVVLSVVNGFERELQGPAAGDGRLTRCIESVHGVPSTTGSVSLVDRRGPDESALSRPRRRSSKARRLVTAGTQL